MTCSPPDPRRAAWIAARAAVIASEDGTPLGEALAEAAADWAEEMDEGERADAWRRTLAGR